MEMSATPVDQGALKENGTYCAFELACVFNKLGNNRYIIKSTGVK
jgi:hypothetical protein